MMAFPPLLVARAQPEPSDTGRASGADQAGRRLEPLGHQQRLGLRQEGRPAGPSWVLGGEGVPFTLVDVAEVESAGLGPFTLRDMARPAIDRMVRRNGDHVAAVEGVEHRPADQRLEEFKTVPADLPCLQAGQAPDREAHGVSPQTVLRALASTGSSTSACP